MITNSLQKIRAYIQFRINNKFTLIFKKKLMLKIFYNRIIHALHNITINYSKPIINLKEETNH